MEDRPRNLKTMLSDAKDTSELMVDLAYAADVLHEAMTVDLPEGPCFPIDLQELPFRHVAAAVPRVKLSEWKENAPGLNIAS